MKLHQFQNQLLTLSLITGLLVTSCAFDSNRRDDNRQEQEIIQQKGVENCLALQGVYEGSITTTTATFPAEVGINCEPKPLGDKKDSYGNPIMVQTPFMTLARKDIAQRVRFQLTYDDVTGSLSHIGEPTKLDSQFGNTIVGAIQTFAIEGLYGTFNGSQIYANLTAAVPTGVLNVTKDPNKVFSQNDDVSFKKMIKGLAQTVSVFEGKYCGYFQVTQGDYSFIHAELIVSLRQQGDYEYTMTGQYNRIADSEGDSSGILNSSTKLTFDLDNPLPLVTVHSVPKSASSYTFKMYGKMEGNDYYGTYYEDLVGTTANFYLIKKSYSSKKPPTSCYAEAKKKLEQKFPKSSL